MSQSGYVRGKPEVSWWLKQIREGMAYREDVAREKRWPIWRNMYRGQWSGDILPSNLIFRTLRTIIPRTYFRNPTVYIRPGKPGAETLAFAMILTHVDNRLLHKMRIKKQIKRVIQDAFLTGTGDLKIGYGAEFTPSPELLGTEAPFTSAGSVEYNTFVQPNMPWVQRTAPGRLIVPAGLEDFDDTRWVSHWIQRDIADVKADPRLKHTSNLKPSARSVIGDNRGSNSYKKRKHTDDTLVDLIEIRDKKYQTAIVLAPYMSDKVLYFGEDDLQVRGRLPHYPIIFNNDDENFWGISDCQILEPQAIELNHIRTQAMRLRRLAVVKILAELGKITPEEASQLNNHEEGVVAWVKNIDAVKTIVPGSIPVDLWAQEEAVMRDVREQMGFSRNQMGEYAAGSADRTATEAQLVAQAAEIRIDERRDIISDALVDIVEHLHHVIFTQWTGEQVVEITGPLGVPLWVTFKGPMLKGAYDVKVDPDSSLPETKEVRQAKSMKLYETFQGNPIIDQYRLVKDVLMQFGGPEMEGLVASMNTGLGAGPQSAMQPGQLGNFMQQFAQLSGEKAQMLGQGVERGNA